MIEDYQTINNIVGPSLINMLLRDLNELLKQHGKDITNYDLPELPAETNEDNPVPRVIQEELSVQIPNEDIESVGKLNHDQMVAFNTIMNVIDHNQSQVFFVEGPGGTGKTFLYRALMAILRNRGKLS